METLFSLDKFRVKTEIKPMDICRVCGKYKRAVGDVRCPQCRAERRR